MDDVPLAGGVCCCSRILLEHATGAGSPRGWALAVSWVSVGQAAVAAACVLHRCLPDSLLHGA